MRSLVLLALPFLLLPAQNDAANGAAHREVHELVLKGLYKDHPERTFSVTELIGGGGSAPRGFYDLTKALKALPEEGGEILVDVSATSLGLSMPQISELHRVFASLRKKGYKTTAYLENAGRSNYLVAALCDRVLMADMASLDFASPAMGVLFMKDAMNLLGIEFQVTRMGDFKGAVEPFMRSRMSEHLKEHYEVMLHRMNDEIVDIVAGRRGLSKDRVREAQGLRLLTAKAARDLGLVDALVPWKGARSAYAAGDAPKWKALAKPKKKRMNLMALISGAGKKKGRLPKKPSVVVLHLTGAIEDGTKKKPGAIVSGPTVSLIRRLVDHENTKGVVVRVNSPGGSATASEAILLALRDLARKKPVVVSMGDLAASGGYYISMVGCPIFAEQGTITGSIGVFGMRPNMAALSRRIGLHNELVALDEGASFGDIFQPLSDGQLENLQTFVSEVYDRFLTRILDVRKLNRERLMDLAGGRVWSGAQAVDAELVDEIGGLEHALVALRKKVGGEEELPVEHLPTISDNPFEMFESMFGVLVRERRLELEWARRAGFDLSGPLSVISASLQDPTGRNTWMMLPFEMRIR